MKSTSHLLHLYILALKILHYMQRCEAKLLPCPIGLGRGSKGDIVVSVQAFYYNDLS